MGTAALLVSGRFRRSSTGQTGSRYFPDLHLGTQNAAHIVGLGLACEMTRQESTSMQRLAELRTLLSDSLALIPDVEIVGWEGTHAPGIYLFAVDSRP